MAFDLVNTTFAHYELLAPLGAGAMSEVYLARDTRLDKSVAVKVINENLLRRADLVERFEREAKAAARLEHVNVATIYFYGTHDGKPFYAMELIRGWSLGDIVEGCVAFTTNQALALFAQAAVGLHAAQTAGVTHRDIKPGNLMVTEDGILKIVDFGLAKLGDDKSLTRSGRMMGTPYYIAPEVVQGRGGDHRSDIYSLGVTMFHFMVGRPPFDAETPYGVMMQHINDPVPAMSELNPQLPEALSTLVAAMMAKDPEARPRTFEDVHIALRKLAAELPVQTRSEELSWCGIDKMNTGSAGGRCSVCKRPYGVRELPESFHVDLVAWNKNDARELVAVYISRAVNQTEEDVRALLDPLPFRAAFRLPRERAKKMHRTFFELGADVSLVPAEEEAEGRPTIRTLPFKPKWPRPEKAGRTASDVWKAPRGPKGSRSLDTSTVVAAVLALAVIVLGVLLLQKEDQATVGTEPTTEAPPPDPVTPAEPESSTVVPREDPSPGVEDPTGSTLEEPTPGEPADEPATTAEPDTPVDTDAEPPLRSDRFLLATGDIPPEVAAAVLAALELAADRVSETVGLDGPLAITLTTRPIDSSWRSATFVPEIEFPTGGVSASGHAVLAQAATHLVAKAAIRKAAGPQIPPWLLVGLTGYLDQGPIEESDWPPIVQAAGLPSEADIGLRGNPEETERLTRAYASFLVESRGWAPIRDLLGHLGRGRTIDDAALRALGTTPADLEQEWITLAGGLD